MSRSARGPLLLLCFCLESRLAGTSPSTDTWTRHQGLNCYEGHGATEIDNNTIGSLTIKECEAKCEEMADCTGVTLQTDGDVEPGNCWRRKGIVLPQCQSAFAEYDTYVRTPGPAPAPTPSPKPAPTPAPPGPAPAPTGSWKRWPGLNCYDGGHGATVIDTDPIGVLSVNDCEDRCSQTPGCTGITIETTDLENTPGDCWRRKDIVPAQCDKTFGAKYDTYTKSAPTPPTPAPTPPTPAPTPGPPPGKMGPGAGPWEHVEPEAVGLTRSGLDEALAFINQNVKGRQCFLLVKDGKLAYEWYDPSPDPADTAIACDVSPAQTSGNLYTVAQTCIESKSQKGWSYHATAKAVMKDGNCLDATIATQLEMKPCNASSPAQRFAWSPEAKLLLASDGRCVDVDLPKGAMSPKVQLYKCDGNFNQKFNFNNDTSMSTNKGGKLGETYRCLEVTPADPAGTCRLGQTFGCENNNSMWVTNTCGGQFKCNGRTVHCAPGEGAVGDPIGAPEGGPSNGRRRAPAARTRCNCDLENQPHEGYSMTKSIGAYIIFLAATQDGLDIDGDITAEYGIPSPRPYPITLRMMMSQVIGGSHRPGELWRYDEMGDMWMHLMPKVVEKATGHPASYYMGQLSRELGLSPQFHWANVNTQWYRGMQATCRDWARFGQLIINEGYWGGKQLISKTFFQQMTQPTKYNPYNDYSNPCYGLLVWINADKSKHPGCCWEASRLPEPRCNNDTFMPGAVHDMALIIGLYGQVAMTLPSVNTVVVGFGVDLRPIEPARIGYYPAVCKVLGIPCNTPPPVPKPKCTQNLECIGMAAQCFSGGAWNHSEPSPGGVQCLRCFQNRLPMYEAKFPEAHDMVKNWCPNDPREQVAFMNCFCFEDKRHHTNANPFAPWPTTTTTTLPHGPFPPPPPPSPPPPPPPPGKPCQMNDGCVEALHAFKCAQNGGRLCYKCLHANQDRLTAAGCPSFRDEDFASRGFCWCGPGMEDNIEYV